MGVIPPYSRRSSKERKEKMRLTPPTKTVFWIALVLAALGLVAYLLAVFVSGMAYLLNVGFWLALVGYVLLALGNTLKGF